MTTFKPGDLVKDCVSGELFTVKHLPEFRPIRMEYAIDWLEGCDNPNCHRYVSAANPRLYTPMPGEIRAAQRRMG